MSKYQITDVDALASMFKALSNPNRLRVFLRLVGCCQGAGRRGTDDQLCACVGELGEELDIAPSTLSHHVKELRQAGLIEIRRCGQHVQCRLADGPLRQLAAFFESPPRSLTAAKSRR
ncbi:MAG: ArsR/SmtB family transcription factor [Planctomycetota bacterium]|jgi:ArsR family transcriptional regulator